MLRPITLLIPTYNRARALEAVWPSYVGHPLVERIIVVSDGCTDGTASLVRRLAESSPTPVMLVEHPEQRGQPVARHTALAEARTEWVLFGEDDVWLPDDYINTLYRQAHEQGAAAIAGRILAARVPGSFDPGELHDPVTEIHAPEQVFDLVMMDADFGRRVVAPVPAPFVHTIALMQRRLFDLVAFDDAYGGNGWREETDFYLSVNALGERVVFTPDAVCYHLRGPICATGGQRINRLAIEWFAWRNTHRLVRKHWRYLSRAHGLRGTALLWMLRFYARRQLLQARRIMRSGLRSTYHA